MHTSTGSTKVIHLGRLAAERRIRQDLMNAFLMEQFFRLDEENLIPISEAPKQLRDLYPGTYGGDPCRNRLYFGELLFLVQPSIRLGMEWVQESPIYQRKIDGSWRLLEAPAGLADAVLRTTLSAEHYALPGVADFLNGIETATRQLALSLSPEHLDSLHSYKPSSAYEWYMKGERIAALRDRPFHPSAKAKIGFGEHDCLQYSAEFGRTLRLRWIAVKRDAVQHGSDSEEGLSCLNVLDENQRKLVEAELAQRGIRKDQYVLLPVHPWQLRHIIWRDFAREIEAGTIHVLKTEAGEVLATSSLRSMALRADSAIMLKLPVSVLSLGAARYLPVVKLLNGLAGEKLLRQAIACDESLRDRVYLCDERHWWGYMPASMGLFDDHPRHLAAQLRLYPSELLEEGYKIFPMAALGVNMEGRHFLSELLGKQPAREEIMQFYAEAASLFYDVVMRLFKVGVVPEIHGQNCCLVMKHNKLKAILFRDHDSVRLHQPYLDKHGIRDPEYRIRPGYSNSLYNETLEKLIFYVQSLGTQVNLAAIMESLSEVYAVPQQELWAITESAWKESLGVVPLPAEDRSLLYREIFERREWPTKLIIRPLLEADGVPGAMPSGKGQGHNPFYMGGI